MFTLIWVCLCYYENIVRMTNMFRIELSSLTILILKLHLVKISRRVSFSLVNYNLIFIITQYRIGKISYETVCIKKPYIIHVTALSNTFKHYRTLSNTIEHHQTPPNTFKHLQTPSNTIKRHQTPLTPLTPSNTTKHHETPWITTKHHQTPSNVFKRLQTPSSTIKRHQTPLNTIKHH